jgi:phosphoribosylformimino-5-aminoimidazole carboxamide ribotide isomerase
VGGSLADTADYAVENFVAQQDAGFYARLYRNSGISGGHIIILNSKDSEYYSADIKQAKLALENFPGGLQIGGGITADNAMDFIGLGASHVIVTSYVFRDGSICFENLEKLVACVGKDKIVLDLSCRKRDDSYYIVTDRWQRFTDTILNAETMDLLASYCDEFLIHAVDVEGKASGIEKELVKSLGAWNKIPITYAGGVGSFEDLIELKELSNNKLDVTIGSALSLFGGKMDYEKVLKYMDGGR